MTLDISIARGFSIRKYRKVGLSVAAADWTGNLENHIWEGKTPSSRMLFQRMILEPVKLDN